MHSPRNGYHVSLFGTEGLIKHPFFVSFCGSFVWGHNGVPNPTLENLAIDAQVRMNHGVPNGFGLASIDWVMAAALPTLTRAKNLFWRINFKARSKSKVNTGRI